MTKISEGLRIASKSKLSVEKLMVFNQGTSQEFMVVPTIPSGKKTLREDGKSLEGKSFWAGLVAQRILFPHEVLWALREKPRGVEFLGVMIVEGVLTGDILLNLKKKEDREKLSRLEEIFSQETEVIKW